MGCWGPNQPDLGGRRPVSGVDCAPRTPRCFSASRSRATRQSSGIGARLRRIFKHRLPWCDASYQSGQQVCHRVKQQCAKVVAKLFPEVALGLHFVPSRLEQGTTQLLNLIYQEGTPCSGTDSFPLENRAGRIAPALPHAARPERNVRRGTSPGNRIGILPRGRSRAGSRRACLHRKPPHLEARVHSRILPHSPRVSGYLEHDRSTRQQKHL